MADTAAKPVWYELLTTDIEAAQIFYADVLDWTIARAPYEGIDYRIAAAPDDASIAGLMTMPQPGAPPSWLMYVGVEDVDASVARVTAAGGAVHMPAMTMAGVGRMAMLADPHGAPFYVMRGESDEPSNAFAPGEAATPGHAVWNELTTPDPAASIAFYAAQFGWRQDGAMPMGELGDYQFLYAGAEGIGAVMGPIPGGREGWQPYFLVEDIDAAVERLIVGGGSVIQGPDAIPGDMYSVVAEDPQGVRFGLVGSRVS
ncbi:VOC family protein [Sphingomonas sp. S1-29]|uniref:VOC family protein n=1 Tax=Sphingomonas sp. S1-29 TaxID=2991074 RepID=UPI0022400B92|nr:VOC family protein [Sphingomonas sp. S1-29]UZK68289.1 VOC family protein [Sphingomonas sp. S1-29]